MKRKKLLGILELVKPALSTKELVPIFNNFCFQDGEVYAYNDSVAVVSPCNIDITLGLNGEVLLGLLSNSTATNIKMEVEEEKLALRMAKSRVALPFSTVEDFLFTKPEIKLSTLKLTAEILNAIKNCLLTAAEDSALPALMGVAINLDKTKTFYSCDGDALSRYRLGEKSKAKGQFVMSREFCQLLLRTADKLKLETGKLYIDEDWVSASIGSLKIYGRVIIADTPTDFEKIIDEAMEGGELKYFTQPKAFEQALQRAIIMVDKNDWKTRLSIIEKKIRLTTNSRDKGIIRDNFNLDTEEDHPDIDVNVNAELFLRALKSCQEIAINENCTAFRSGEKLLQLVSHIDA